MTTFEITKPELEKVLLQIDLGKIQLPDFQREWIWDDERIRSLISSVSLSYPIGSIMMLQTGNGDLDFKTRCLIGVDKNDSSPELLILDGQQRLTALYQSLFSDQSVKIPHSEKSDKYYEQWYYIDINSALELSDEEREDSIKGYSKKLDVSEEYDRCLFPISKVFDYGKWREDCFNYLGNNKTLRKTFLKFEENIIYNFKSYNVAIITLLKETPLEAVCRVFEKVNTSRVELNVFDLLTAKYAAHKYKLRDDWNILEKQLRTYKILDGFDSKELNNMFIKITTLIATYYRVTEYRSTSEQQSSAITPYIGCTRKEMFKLELGEYKKCSRYAMEGIKSAIKLLKDLNIYRTKDIPYKTQLVPLSAIYGVLGDEAITAGVKENIIQWYWCGVFGEIYGSTVESRCARDLPEVIKWINGGKEPNTVERAKFDQARLYKLKTSNSAAYKGVQALLLKNGCNDFFTGEPITDKLEANEEIDLHHIFPRDWCNNKGINPDMRECIINKTPLSKKTHRLIGIKPPSQYIFEIQKQAKISKPKKLKEIVESHMIDYPSLIADNFELLFNERNKKIIELIEEVMGKQIIKQ
jgi:hypothetical protein